MGSLTKILSRSEFACECRCGFDTADFEIGTATTAFLIPTINSNGSTSAGYDSVALGTDGSPSVTFTATATTTYIALRVDDADTYSFFNNITAQDSDGNAINLFGVAAEDWVRI